MNLKCFELGPIGNNNYVLTNEDTNEAILIDCTDADAILAFLKSKKVNLKYILLTHGHFDHILGLADLQKEVKTTTIIHKNDASLVNEANEYLKVFGLPPIEIPSIDKTIDEKGNLSFDGFDIKIIHTPGHTPGSVCYLINGILFSGDTLFYAGQGRTDLPGGNYNELQNSINNLFKSLNEDIEVYTGHGPKTTIGREKSRYK
ncbi:MAG: MBL fold metallo-hydrolase [Alphaproteobacteria bacterium]|nr:MBL fold metallo-hydrolase [Alphaproteobacteria bacterium]